MYIMFDVPLDGPKHTFVIPSPPGEIKEGGSVTLSCSSDANPAADYTWFRDNQPMLWEPRRPYTLDPVSSKDRGTYRCQAENQYGYLGSNSVFHRCPVCEENNDTKNKILNNNCYVPRLGKGRQHTFWVK